MIVKIINFLGTNKIVLGIASFCTIIGFVFMIMILFIKVCYNVKCKEYMQTAADGCQSLLCFKDRFMPVFFVLKSVYELLFK